MLYTINIQLANNPCVVVGGGEVARRKVEKLLEAGALVRVVALQAGTELRQLAQQGKIALAERAFEPADVQGAVLVFAATNSQNVNKAVVQAARNENIFVNCADSSDESTFFVPSTVQRGALQLAISSSGTAPLFTKQLRDFFEHLLPKELSQQLDELEQLRTHIKSKYANDAAQREAQIRTQLQPMIDAIIAGLGRNNA